MKRVLQTAIGQSGCVLFLQNNKKVNSMNSKSKLRLFFFTLIFLLPVAGCVAAPKIIDDKFAADDGPYYTAANIWHERPDIWSTNYKRGYIIPAGTEVSGLKLMHYRTWYVEFTVKKTGETFHIHLVPKHNPGLTGEVMLERLFTKKNLTRLTKGFTQSELEAVQNGHLKLGMSKQAVLVSWGYPPEIQTPSLDHVQWTYWKSKFDREVLTFDGHGRLKHILD